MIETIHKLFESPFVHLTDEKKLQDEIAQRLNEHEIEYVKEAPVQGGVIDFLVGQIGIEIKIKGSKREIHRQCKGYCQDERIQDLVLVTSKTCSLPEFINSTRIFVVSLGRAWL